MKYLTRTMTLLVLFLTLAVPTTAPAQDSPVSDVSQEILTRVDSLVTSSVRGVEVGAEFVWPLATRQQKVVGFTVVLSFVLAALLSSFLLWCGLNELGPERGEVAGVAGVITGALSLILTLFTVIGAIPRLLNPEWYALKDILSALGLGG